MSVRICRMGCRLKTPTFLEYLPPYTFGVTSWESNGSIIRRYPPTVIIAMGRKGVYTVDNILLNEEIIALKNANLLPEERLIVNTLLYTGMRVGEFIHMRKDWIDLKREIISIPSRQSCNCCECRTKKGVWSPKTALSARPIVMLPKKFPLLMNTLKEYFDKHNAIMETLDHRSIVWKHLECARKKAGIEHKLFPHVFRGTYATMLYRYKVDKMIIKKSLGWRSLAMLDKYVGLTTDDMKDEIGSKIPDGL